MEGAIVAAVIALFGMVVVCPGINTNALMVVYFILAIIICCIELSIMRKHANDPDENQKAK